MKFAVIGDIHSNIYALQSVYKDLLIKNADFILATGDLVGYFHYPNEVVDFIRQNKILSIQGNHDRNIGNSLPVRRNELDNTSLSANASTGYTNMILTDYNREYLKQLPEELKLKIDDLTVLVVHGSPRGISEYLFENSENMVEVSQSISEDIIICGHTHIPYYKVVNGKHFINAGSVGKPKHGNSNSTYILVNITHNMVNVDIVEVPYDFEKLAGEVEASEILSIELADMVRKGC